MLLDYNLLFLTKKNIVFANFLRFSQIQRRGGKIWGWYIFLGYFSDFLTPKDWFIEKVTKLSSKTLLCLVTFSMNQSLLTSIVQMDLMELKFLQFLKFWPVCCPVFNSIQFWFLFCFKNLRWRLVLFSNLD